MDQLIDLSHGVPVDRAFYDKMKALVEDSPKVNFFPSKPQLSPVDAMFSLPAAKRGELTVHVVKARPAGERVLVSFRSQCDSCQCRVNNPAGWCFKFTDAPEGLCYEQEPRRD